MRRFAPFIVLTVAIGAVVWGGTRVVTGPGDAPVPDASGLTNSR